MEDVPMLVKISDGMSQGEFLFRWRLKESVSS
jgi:hypothetical protein